jgi:hypothetical protein
MLPGRCDASLKKVGCELQDRSYDHVLKQDEREDEAFHPLCEYVARNPERAELVDVDGYGRYPYTGCLIPGYPELHPFEDGFQERFSRIVSHLRSNGLQQLLDL